MVISSRWSEISVILKTSPVKLASISTDQEIDQTNQHKVFSCPNEVHKLDENVVYELTRMVV